MGITEDLNLQGDNYQWLGSIFYFGYLVSRPYLLIADL
jgi:ACS family allantoate permease-like MFS transporter